MRADGEAAVEQLLPAAPGGCPRNVHACSLYESSSLAARVRAAVGVRKGRSVPRRRPRRRGKAGNDLREHRPAAHTSPVCGCGIAESRNRTLACVSDGPRRLVSTPIPPSSEMPMVTRSPKDLCGLALVGSAILAIACGHTDPFDAPPYGTNQPFDATPPARLTLNTGPDRCASWLPDGSGILYSAPAAEPERRRRVPRGAAADRRHAAAAGVRPSAGARR